MRKKQSGRNRIFRSVIVSFCCFCCDENTDACTDKNTDACTDETVTPTPTPTPTAIPAVIPAQTVTPKPTKTPTPTPTPTATPEPTSASTESAESTSGESTASTAASVPESTAPQTGGSATVRQDVNVRNEANATTSIVIGTLSAGNVVTVTGNVNGWAQIDYYGQTAYVDSSYLS